MFHITQERSDFMHFSHSLIERNNNFENLNYVGGDRSNAQKGFIFPLKLCTFLPCTMHMKDAIARYLKEHSLQTIFFGNEKDQVKGLIDCESKTDFREACSKMYIK